MMTAKAGPGRFDLTPEITAASDRIKSDIRRTPLQFSPALSALTGARVHLKWESEQRTGSFKFRGALNKVRSLSQDEKRRGVVSASTGNHGLGVGLAAEMEGVRVTLVLPRNVAPAKRARLEKGHAEIIFHGESCDRAEIWARRLAAETGRVFISPYNDRQVIAGQGTIGLEVMEDLPDVEVALVPVGGGGLIAGIAGWLKGASRSVEVHGVEPLNSPVMSASLSAGRIVEVSEKETIADAVAGGLEPGCITFPLCRTLVDSVILVEEPLIAKAMSLLLESHQKMVEGAGALPLAGLIKNRARLAGREVLLVVSGGNVAPEVFRKVVG
jgi:threonine dehydratase